MEDDMSEKDLIFDRAGIGNIRICEEKQALPD